MKMKLWLGGCRRPFHFSLRHRMAMSDLITDVTMKSLGRGQQTGDLDMKAAVPSATSLCVLVPDLCSNPGGRDGIMVAQGCFF